MVEQHCFGNVLLMDQFWPSQCMAVLQGRWPSGMDKMNASAHSPDWWIQRFPSHWFLRSWTDAHFFAEMISEFMVFLWRKKNLCGGQANFPLHFSCLWRKADRFLLLSCQNTQTDPFSKLDVHFYSHTEIVFSYKLVKIEKNTHLVSFLGLSFVYDVGIWITEVLKLSDMWHFSEQKHWRNQNHVVILQQSGFNASYFQRHVCVTQFIRPPKAIQNVGTSLASLFEVERVYSPDCALIRKYKSR